jgi:hypothetical protein
MLLLYLKHPNVYVLAIKRRELEYTSFQTKCRAAKDEDKMVRNKIER